jgi:hypothetical protein
MDLKVINLTSATVKEMIDDLVAQATKGLKHEVKTLSAHLKNLQQQTPEGGRTAHRQEKGPTHRSQKKCRPKID